MGDVRFPIPSLHLILVRQHRQDEVSRFALALPHQKAARFPLLRQKLLCLLASEVPMVPSEEHQRGARSAWKHAGQELRSVLGLAFMGNPFLGSQPGVTPT